MKKIFYLTAIIFALVYACEPYEEFKGDNEFTTVYFPFQQPVRQLVVGEGLSFYIGVVMGGKRSNDNNEWARIEIDESLVEGTPMKVLPSSYYTLSTTSEVAIPAGDFRGLIKHENGIFKPTSFEQQINNLNKAAFYSKMDELNYIASNVFYGQIMKIGTGMVDILLDMDMLNNMDSTKDKIFILPPICIFNCNWQRI